MSCLYVSRWNLLLTTLNPECPLNCDTGLSRVGGRELTILLVKQIRATDRGGQLRLHNLEGDADCRENQSAIK